MTQHTILRTDPFANSPRRFEQDARTAIRLLGPLAQRLVPASTMHFGAWLGWPEWLRSGTSLTCTGRLPAMLCTADDLLVVANLLDHEGAGRILIRSLQDIWYPVGPLAALALANAPTLRAALGAFARLTNAHRDYFHVELDERGADVRLTLRQTLPHSALADVIAILILILAYRLIASYSFTIAGPVVLRCSLADDSDNAELWGLFDCQVDAGANANELQVTGPLADTANPLADARLWQLALEQIADKERQLVSPREVGAIRSRIAEALSSENRAPRLKEMGGKEMSERTIARMLAAHGTSFHTIVDEERRLRASILINDPLLSLAEVAERLGFNDLSSFGRSFRQWFGVAPGKFRSDNGAPDPW